MKRNLAIALAALAAAIVFSCSQVTSPGKSRAGSGAHQVAVTVFGAGGSSAPRRGLIDDTNVKSISVAAVNSGGGSLGSANLTKGTGYWSGSIDVGTYTGLATFTATAKNGGSVAIYSGWNTVTLTGSGDVVSIAVTALGGLVGEWLFNDGTTNDSNPSGTAHNGTAYGSAVPTRDRFCRANSAYHFDGTNSYIASTETIGSYSKITYSLWLRSTGDGMGGFPRVLNLGSNSNVFEFSSNAQISLNTYINNNCVASVPITLKKWMNVTLTSDGTTVAVYANGSSIASVSSSQGAVTIDGFHFGNNPGGTFFNGDIDDVRVYDRALTATEVSDLYHEGGWDTSFLGPNPSLIAAWLFDNGTPDDSSGNGPNGAAYGSAVPTSDRFDHANSAYHFDGTNSYIASSETMGSYSQISYSVWLRSTGDGTGQFPRILELCSNVFEFSSNAQTSLNTYINNNFAISVPVTLGEWMNVTLTSDGSTVVVYANGSSILSVSSGQAATTINPFYLGSNPAGTFFNGDIDDVRVYDRALTASEASDIYHAGGWGL